MGLYPMCVCVCVDNHILLFIATRVLILATFCAFSAFGIIYAVKLIWINIFERWRFKLYRQRFKLFLKR